MHYVSIIYSRYNNKAKATIRKANSGQKAVPLCKGEGYNSECIIAIMEVD